VPFVVRINDRSFEDRKRTLEEIKFLFFNTVYLWTAFFFFFFSKKNFLFNFAFLI